MIDYQYLKEIFLYLINFEDHLLDSFSILQFLLIYFKFHLVIIPEYCLIEHF